jgi:hypothetical protein
MVKYEIKKGIPVPPAKGGGANTRVGAPITFPFYEMEIGDCFDVPENTNHKDGEGRDRTQACIISASAQWKLRNDPDAQFTTRRLEGFVRCWRIA